MTVQILRDITTKMVENRDIVVSALQNAVCIILEPVLHAALPIIALYRCWPDGGQWHHGLDHFSELGCFMRHEEGFKNAERLIFKGNESFEKWNWIQEKMEGDELREKWENDREAIDGFGTHMVCTWASKMCKTLV